MFYKFLKISIGTAVRIFFRKIEVIGQEYVPVDKPVIFVSNHPSAFMDPLVLGSFSNRELYFFARADIFAPGFVSWITKKAHMSPIYRIVDGIDSLEKNDKVFAHGYKLLSENKVLLLFGEGVTDEEFIRRVKPMKKGSMRISLGAENKFDFKLGVNIVCVGINYSDPRKFRSDLLIRFSKPIEVSRYKHLFLEHNNKAMVELNKEIYSRLKEQVLHVDEPGHADLFEQLLVLSGKGFNNDFSDKTISLDERWKQSKKIEQKLNALNSDNASLSDIKNKIHPYFKRLSEHKIHDQLLARSENPGIVNLMFLIFAFPVFLVGLVSNYPPVKLSVYLSRKISRRPVFWSGTDMTFSIITLPLYYCLISLLLMKFSDLQSLQYLFILILMPLSGIVAFEYFEKLNAFGKFIVYRKVKKSKETLIKSLAEERKMIIKDLERILGEPY